MTMTNEAGSGTQRGPTLSQITVNSTGLRTQREPILTQMNRDNYCSFRVSHVISFALVPKLVH